MTSTEIKWNWEVVGNKNIVNFLQKNIENQNLAHAYLFAGPDKIGRKIVAENFIKSLLCLDNSSKPCSKCNNCKQIERGIHPDIFYLTKFDDKKNISIEQVRKLQGKLSLGSFANSYKVAIIDGADLLSIEAANSLLKILEEPTKKTILILIAQRIDFLPETILSRCQVFKFLPVAEKEIFDYLISKGADRQQAENFTHLSFGCPGLAIDLFNDKELFEEYNEKVEEFFLLSNGEISKKFEIINDLANTKIDRSVLIKNLDLSLSIWGIAIRDMLYIKNELVGFIGNLKFQNKLQQLSQKYSKKELVNLLRDLYKLRNLLEKNVNPRLVLENFALNL